MSKTSMHFVSEMAGSIGEVTGDLSECFEKEFELTKEWEKQQPSNKELLFCHFIQPEFVKSEDFQGYDVKVIIQPIDGTSIKDDVVDMLNMFDLIITPGTAGRSIMLQNGVLKPIVVIPNFFKPNILRAETSQEFKSYVDREVGDRTVIYHESTFHPRKGIEILYESYIKAFSDKVYTKDVVLLLKDSKLSPGTILNNESMKMNAVRLQRKYKHPAKILKISCNLEEDELAYLWDRCDIYASFSKMEGFGIPLMRMMVMGKPIITLNSENNGYMDYLNNDNAILVPTKDVVAKEEFMWLYKEDTKWSVPNIDDCVSGFEKIYSSLKEVDYIKTSKEVYRFSFENVCNMYVSTLKSLIKSKKIK